MRKALRESRIKYPSPDFTAIISAATTTSHAMPRLILKAGMIAGNIAGNITSLIVSILLKLKFAATWKYRELMWFTALMVLTKRGKKLDKKIRKMAGLSPIPNHSIAKGIQASGDIGRKN
jgi:hypothetical protein